MKERKVGLVDAFVYRRFIRKMQMDFGAQTVELEALKTWS